MMCVYVMQVVYFVLINTAVRLFSEYDFKYTTAGINRAGVLFHLGGLVDILLHLSTTVCFLYSPLAEVCYYFHYISMFFKILEYINIG